MIIKVAIIGASGYAGAQLAWLLHAHPHAEVLYLAVQSQPDTPYANLYPGFDQSIIQKTTTVENVLEHLDDIDVLFLALPHGISMKLLSTAELPPTLKIIDLGADFRLRDKNDFKTWYDTEHLMPEILKDWVYGLPEMNRMSIEKSRFIANPGCYPTASTLAILPLLKNQLIDPKSIIIDAKSGVSGAGRGMNLGSHFCECHDSIKAYGVATHRHTAEIEQSFSIISGQNVTINFTPHLIPMPRGILASVYCNAVSKSNTDALIELYENFYANEFFIRVRKELPETRWVALSNFCDISVRYDPRTDRIIAIAAIDNLVKGAAGQAVQNMNILFGMKESLGLPQLPIIP